MDPVLQAQARRLAVRHQVRQATLGEMGWQNLDRDWAGAMKQLKTFNLRLAQVRSWLMVPPAKLAERVQKDWELWDLSLGPPPPQHPSFELHPLAMEPLATWVRQNFQWDITPRRAVNRASNVLWKEVRAGQNLPAAVKAYVQALDQYAEYANSLISQAGPRKFKYQGFQVDNPGRLPDRTLRKLLDGVDYVVALFKKRGVFPLLQASVSKIFVRHQNQGEGRVHGWYTKQTKVIGLLAEAADTGGGYQLKQWLHEVFLHEIGHHVHMNLLHPEAHQSWNSGWEQVEKVKGKQEELKSVSTAERRKFWDLLWKAKGDLRAIRLKGVDRMKFHAWLHNPYMGGEEGAYVTAKQLRWNKDRGADLSQFLADPETYFLKRFGIGPDHPDVGVLYQNTVRRKQMTLGVTGIEGIPWPRLSDEQVAEYSTFDSDVAKALDQLGVPTEYAKTNEKEDFAESFVAFMANPGRLSDNARYRMQKALSLSGLYGKPIMRLAGDLTNVDALLAFAKSTGKSWVIRGLDLDSSAQARDILSWMKAVQGLRGHAARLWASQVQKVRFDIGRGSEDASWERGVMVLVVGKGRQSVATLRSFLIHELGHAVDDLTQGRDAYFEIYGKPPYVSDYASTNASEDFAETFRAVLEEPRRTRQLTPLKYEDMIRRI